MGYIEVLLRYCEQGKWGEFSAEVVKMADAILVVLKKEKEEMLKALAKMKCNRKYCDLRLSCGSEGEVWGSSMWLTTRCPSLKDMICDGISDFPGTSVEGLHLVLEYLYLGTPRGYLQKLEPGSQRSVIYDALRIAGKLELDHLQEMMVKWLKALKNGQELVIDKGDEDKGKEALLQDLSNMLNNAYADLDLRSSQGRDCNLVKELWLKARLAELEEEFSSSEEMVSKLWTIISDTDSEIVAVVLEYLYRGSPKVYLKGQDTRARWDFGLGVVSLSLSLRLLRFVDIMLDTMMIEIVIYEGDMKDSIHRLSGIREFEREVNLPERSRQKLGTLSDELLFRIERDWLSGDVFGALLGGDWQRKLDRLNQAFMLNNPAYANLLRDSRGREAEFIRERGLKARIAELEEGFDSSKPRININITNDLFVLIAYQYLSRGSSEAPVKESDARVRWDFFLDVVALVHSLSFRLKRCLKSVWDIMWIEAMICSGNIEDNIYRLSRLREFQTEWERKRYFPKHSPSVY